METQINPILSFFNLLKLKPKIGKFKLKVPNFLKLKPKKTKLNLKSLRSRVRQLRKKFVAMEWEYIGFMRFDDPIDSIPIMNSINEESMEGWIYGD